MLIGPAGTRLSRKLTEIGVAAPPDHWSDPLQVLPSVPLECQTLPGDWLGDLSTFNARENLSLNWSYIHIAVMGHWWQVP
jgi:hypothetical protein